jgi:probable addiction module antidote protein
MPKRTGDFNAWHLEKLSDPTIAAEYLNTVWTHSRDLFLDAVKDVIQARQVSSVAKQVGMKRESLYRSFSSTVGNPTWTTMQSVLEAVGVEFPGLQAIGSRPQNSNPPISSGTKKRRGKRRRTSNTPHQQILLPLPSIAKEASTGFQVPMPEQSDATGFDTADLINDAKPSPGFIPSPGFMKYQQQGGANRTINPHY